MSNIYLSITGRIGNVVYQRTAPGLGNIPGDPTRTLQVHAYVPHNNSRSPAQLACRARFANSMATWHTLSAAQKNDFNLSASRAGWSGLNLFMSITLRS